ncbi:MAG: hypothetical protein Q9184_007141, partial [Pyrenodesmia sp. 2 TL-2023]
MNGLKKHVRRHIELGEKFAGWVNDEGKELFEIVSGPSFALTVLRVRLPEERVGEGLGAVGNGDEGRTEVKINEGVAGDDVTAAVNGVKGDERTAEAEILEKANMVTKE